MLRSLQLVGIVGLLACGSLAGCARGALPAKPSALAKPVTPKPQPKPAKERLLAALRGLERPGPVLEPLPRSIHTLLEARLAALAPEQREQLLAGELAATMPLLHLKAGGSSGHALLALASSPAASLEAPVAFELLGQVSDEDRLRLVRLAHDLAQRAALHFLRDRVLDVSSTPAAELPPLLHAIERAAVAAERPDLVRLALETWVGSGATAPVMARLGVACGYEQDESCVARALQAVPESDPGHARVLRISKALEGRRDGDPIVKAWSLLHLGRYQDARVALAPVMVKTKTDLRVAAAQAVIVSEGSACPGLQPYVGTPRLCADAVRARPGLAAALIDVEQAWQSKAGRDSASVEAYIGLVHVVPWVTELSVASDAASLERNFGTRYQALSKVLAELPSEKPLAVFCSALAAGVHSGLRAAHGQRPSFDANQRQELWFGALGVEAAAPRLAVASVLAADQSVLPLLPSSAPVSLGAARAGLLAWEAAGTSDAGVIESAKAALAQHLGQAPPGSTESASAVLLLAELEAATQPSERTHAALAQIASQLIGQPLPPELALRAVLDAAGALERMGRSADALGVLTKAAEIESLPGPAADLLSLIRAEKLVLAWDAKRDPQRKTLAKELAALQLGAAPPTLAFVVGAWGSPNVLRQGKRPPKALLEERIGVRAAESMARGLLRSTRVSLRVAYTFQAGVTPEVAFDPMLVPLVRPDLLQKAL